MTTRPSSGPQPRRLEVGIAVPDGALAAWRARCIDVVRANPSTELAAVFVVDEERGDRTWAWNVHLRRLERRCRALAGAGSIRDRAGIQPRLRIGRPPPALDLLVVLGPVSDEFLAAAPWPVWAFEWEGALPGFDAIRRGEAATGVRLQARTGTAGWYTLGAAHVRTVPHSLARTVDAALFAAADLLGHATRQAATGPASSTRSSGATGQPTTRAVAWVLLRQAMNLVTSQVRAVTRSPQWNVGIVPTPIARCLDPTFRPSIDWFPDGDRDTFRADPFGLVGAGGDEFVMLETYDHTTGLGVISAVDRSGRSVGTGPVLAVDGHASYPYLLEHEGEIYCTPQLDAGAGIRMFRCVDYPTKWVLECTLVSDVIARDPTVFHHAGRWWVVFTDGAAGPMTHLHVWWADSLLGPWSPHGANPVKIDVRSARPAGTPFVHEGHLYRPAQDCSVSYGGGVAICRVDVLTPTEFRETVVRLVAPPPGPYRRGLHTLASFGTATLVDGQRSVFSFAGSRRALASRLPGRRAARDGR